MSIVDRRPPSPRALPKRAASWSRSSSTGRAFEARHQKRRIPFTDGGRSSGVSLSAPRKNIGEISSTSTFVVAIAASRPEKKRLGVIATRDDHRAPMRFGASEPPLGDREMEGPSMNGSMNGAAWKSRRGYSMTSYPVILGRPKSIRVPATNINRAYASPRGRRCFSIELHTRVRVAVTTAFMRLPVFLMAQYLCQHLCLIHVVSAGVSDGLRQDRPDGQSVHRDERSMRRIIFVRSH